MTTPTLTVYALGGLYRAVAFTGKVVSLSDELFADIDL